MSYPVGTPYQNPANYPGYAPTRPAQGGIQMYQAQVLGQDTYQRSYPQPTANQTPWQNPNYPPQAAYPAAYPQQYPQAYPQPYPQPYPQQGSYPVQPAAFPGSTPTYPAPNQGAMTTTMNAFGAFSSLVAAFMGFFRRTPAPSTPPQAPSQPLNPYANVALPDRSQQSDEDFVNGLYLNVLGRQPDAGGFQAHVGALRGGVDRHEVYRTFMESDEHRAQQLAPQQPPMPLPIPTPTPTPAPLEPISIDLVKGVARDFVAAHPEIANRPSYDDINAVATLREGVIAMLLARGYRAGRILGPDGQPYPQMIAFGNPNDPTAKAYRVTAGGARIAEAITVGYCDQDVAWSEVH